MICAFTGHRPEHLPWGRDEDDPRCRALKILLRRTVQQVYDRGFRTFLCGMARGCDQYFCRGRPCLPRRRDCAGGDPTAMVPCPSQKDGWPAGEQARYDALLAACSAVEVLEPVYTPGCMLRRNRAMVQRASLLISVFDGTPGGTASTPPLRRQTGHRDPPAVDVAEKCLPLIGKPWQARSQSLPFQGRWLGEAETERSYQICGDLSVTFGDSILPFCPFSGHFPDRGIGPWKGEPFCLYSGIFSPCITPFFALEAISAPTICPSLTSRVA